MNHKDRQIRTLTDERDRLNARVAELEGAILRLHDQVDRAMGDTDLDGDPLTEAMGRAYGLVTDQSGKVGS